MLIINRKQTNKQSKQIKTETKQNKKNIKETKTKTLESPYFLVSLNQLFIEANPFVNKLTWVKLLELSKITKLTIGGFAVISQSELDCLKLIASHIHEKKKNKKTNFFIDRKLDFRACCCVSATLNWCSHCANHCFPSWTLWLSWDCRFLLWDAGWSFLVISVYAWLIPLILMLGDSLSFLD